MHIIMGKEAAEALKENYTVLELETFYHNGQDITAYCVVDQVPIMELPALESYKQQHSDFIDQLNKKNFKYCVDAAPFLKGRFNGDLDSFYDEIVNRYKE